MRTAIRTALLIVDSWLLLCAQTVNNPPTFDAASVKPATVPEGVTLTDGDGGAIAIRRGSDSGRLANTGGPGTDDPGRIHYPLISLKQLLRRAWSSYFEIDGPGWLDTRVVAVDATMPTGTTREQFQEMLRNLIISRFELKYHTGTKKVPGYALVVNKSGPKMKKSLDQSNIPMGPPPAPTGRDRDGFLVFPGGAGRWCVSMDAPGDRARKSCQQQTMQDLAKDLGELLKAVVTDETGLTGKYDFMMTYAGGIEPGRALASSLPASAQDIAGAAEPLFDIFSALQSQLGLKLLTKKVPVETLVIEHIDKTPVGN